VTTATIKPAKQDRTTLALLFVAALVAVGGIGFAVGHLTAPSSTAANNNGGRGSGNGGFVRPSLAPGETFNPGQFGGGNGRGFVGGGTVEGTVQSIDGSQLTIKLANGSTVTVDLSGSTTYHNETAASSSDVKTGSTVLIQIDTSAQGSQAPSPGTSGSPTARSITAKDVLITAP
jgi:hypothetical protein